MIAHQACFLIQVQQKHTSLWICWFSFCLMILHSTLPTQIFHQSRYWLKADDSDLKSEQKRIKKIKQCVKVCLKCTCDHCQVMLSFKWPLGGNRVTKKNQKLASTSAQLVFSIIFQTIVCSELRNKSTLTHHLACLSEARWTNCLSTGRETISVDLIWANSGSLFFFSLTVTKAHLLS